MSAWAGKHPVEIFIELEARALRVFRGGALRSWTLQRDAEGRLDAAFRRQWVEELGTFVGRRAWQSRMPALCAIPAGGVSFRRWSVPAKAPDLEGILRLRLESEFPLSPDELAWGWVPLGAAAADAGASREILVVAVKRAGLQEIHDALVEAGLAPRYTPAALARASLQAWPSEGGVLLHVGRDQSEWLMWDALGPSRLRVVSWGEVDLVQALGSGMGLGPDEADALLTSLAAGTGVAGDGAMRGVEAAVEGLGSMLSGLPPAGLLRLTGARGVCPAVSRAVAARCGSSVRCEVLAQDVAEGPSTAMAGLRRAMQAGGSSLAVLEMQAPEEAMPRVPETPRRWLALAALLLGLLLALPYVEAWASRPGLAERVESVKARQGQLRMIDREVEFLRYLKTNQTAHLDTLLVIGRCVPNGARIDSFNLNRKGELSLRVSMRQPPEAVEFRKKMVNSGFFQDVVVEEQSPSPDRQKLLVRLSAVLKPAAAREGLPILGTNEPAGGGGSGGGPGGPPGMPMGMPPGFPMPMPPG